MLFKIFLLACAIIFWPISIALSSVFILILGWSFFSVWRSIDFEQQTTRDEKTGQLLTSFLMGGQWREDEAPSLEDCVNAWSIFLAEAKHADISNPQTRNHLSDRAIYLLNVSIECEREYDYPVAPELLYLLHTSNDLEWLQNEIKAGKKSLNFDYDNTLQLADTTTLDELMGLDFNDLVNEKVEQVSASIPSYDEEEIQNLIREFTDSSADITVTIEAYYPTSYSMPCDNFKWDGKTLTQTIFACAVVDIEPEEMLSLDQLREAVWDRIYEIKNYESMDYIYSQTTLEHCGETVIVISELEEEDASYIQTVHERRISYSVYEKKTEVDTDLPEIWKVTFKKADHEAVFEINHPQLAEFLKSIENQGL